MKQCFIEYGTAGFRSSAETLDTILFRVGMLAVLRSKKKSGKTVGLMITASHNPESDNGVKLIDPLGEMLEQSWECIATALANAADDQVDITVAEIIQKEEIDLKSPSSVFIGRDTRSSSPKLSEIAIKGIISLHGTYKDYGIVTTPVLHYLVFHKNTYKGSEPTGRDYNQKFINAFKVLNEFKNEQQGNYIPTLILDAANGVGALKIKEVQDELQNLLEIRLYNGGNGILNHECGADFVKVQKKAPKGIPLEANTRCASFDGDADRLVYYYIDNETNFHLLDGDKIAIIIAGYLIEIIRKAKLDITLGLVQTAYANGSSSDYIRNVLKIPVACVPTGVKHLHQKASEFEIGVYFEANGHGSVLYRNSAEEKIRSKAKCNAGSKEELKSAQTLLAFMELTNQTVGDAFSDMLLVETILKARNWSLTEWENTYTDLPSRLLKVHVKDRSIIKTDYTETICLNPPEIQENINKLVSKIPKGRSFVRASGTENVVRVYAEAFTQEEADKLGLDVARIVYQFAEGVGNLPTI